MQSNIACNGPDGRGEVVTTEPQKPCRAGPSRPRGEPRDPLQQSRSACFGSSPVWPALTSADTNQPSPRKREPLCVDGRQHTTAGGMTAAPSGLRRQQKVYVQVEFTYLGGPYDGQDDYIAPPPPRIGAWGASGFYRRSDQPSSGRLVYEWISIAQTGTQPSAEETSEPPSHV